MANALTMYLNFLRAGLLKHGQPGGLVPSQRFLIARMMAPVPASYRGQIIELGAGTGTLTVRLAPQQGVLSTSRKVLNLRLARPCHDAKVCRAGSAFERAPPMMQGMVTPDS